MDLSNPVMCQVDGSNLSNLTDEKVNVKSFFILSFLLSLSSFFRSL